MKPAPTILFVVSPVRTDFITLSRFLVRPQLLTRTHPLP